MSHRILIIAPHCDDAELGVGGYIARAVAAGSEVTVAVMAVSPVHFHHCDGPVSVATRQAETQAAMRILGAGVVFCDRPDGQLHLEPRNELVGQIDGLIDEHRPDELFVPLPSAHQDHRTVFDACVTASRPNPAKHRPARVAAYEYALISWGDGAHFSPFAGGWYVDVSEHMEKKLEALACHASQMRGQGHLISVEATETLGRYRGMERGVRYAELFYILQMSS